MQYHAVHQYMLCYAGHAAEGCSTMVVWSMIIPILSAVSTVVANTLI